MSDVMDIVLLTALPASGKSEVRKYLSSVDKKELQQQFHFGDVVQLDDYPYVYLMHVIDDALMQIGKEAIFYNEDGLLKDGREWATLVNLLNEDYFDIVNHKEIFCSSAGYYTLERMEKAAIKAGFDCRLFELDPMDLNTVAKLIEQEAQKALDEKLEQYRDDLTGCTFVVEFARGGKDGSTMPLTDTEGYQYTLKHFADEILEKAAVLYIYVTPEQSRAKNKARENPDDPGSNMNHGVPLTVMLHDYGCDDMLYLIENCDKENHIKVNNHYLPVAVIDNTDDKTTFLRDDVKDWSSENVKRIHDCIKAATDLLFK